MELSQSCPHQWEKHHFMHLVSPDLNLTPLAEFLCFCRAQRSTKNVKKQQEVSDLNQDLQLASRMYWLVEIK